MKIEFESGSICIQANASDWGPFTFDFTQGLPSGRTLNSITVRSFVGRVRPSDSDDLSGFTESTSELIASAVVSSDFVCSVYFNRPTTADFVNTKHSLVIEFNLDPSGGGGSHTAFYYNVEVL